MLHVCCTGVKTSLGASPCQTVPNGLELIRSMNREQPQILSTSSKSLCSHRQRIRNNTSWQIRKGDSEQTDTLACREERYDRSIAVMLWNSTRTGPATSSKAKTPSLTLRIEASRRFITLSRASFVSCSASPISAEK